MEYSELHDATLELILLRWAEGTVRIEVVYSKDGVRRRGAILGANVSSASLPRAFPWGESASINGVSVDGRDGETVLRIEMQSGDELTIQASTVSWERGSVIE